MAFKWADPNHVMGDMSGWGESYDAGAYIDWVAQMAIEKINVLSVSTDFCEIDKKMYTEYIIEWQDFDGKWHKIPYTTDKNEIEAMERIVSTVRTIRKRWIELVGYEKYFGD